MEKRQIVCTLGSTDLGRRRKRWERLGARASSGIVVTTRGLRLLFRPEPGAEEELRELALLERECCAFAEWQVHSGPDELVLEIEADSDDGVAAIQATFGQLRSALTKA